MSFSIETDRLLYTLWDNLRPDRPTYRRDEASEVGLLVTLDLRLSHYGSGGAEDEIEYHRSALVHTLFTANTSVFVHTSRDHKRWQDLIPEDWANTSNHDSCWRSDGLRGLHLLHCTLSDEMNEEITGNGYSALAPREFSQFCSLGTLAGKPWQYVDVAHERIPEEYHKRRIVSIRSRDGS